MSVIFMVTFLYQYIVKEENKTKMKTWLVVSLMFSMMFLIKKNLRLASFQASGAHPLDNYGKHIV